MKRLKLVRLGLAAGIAIPLVLTASATASLPEFSGPFPKAFKTKTGANIDVELGQKIEGEGKAGTGEGEVTGLDQREGDREIYRLRSRQFPMHQRRRSAR